MSSLGKQIIAYTPKLASTVGTFRYLSRSPSLGVLFSRSISSPRQYHNHEVFPRSQRPRSSCLRTRRPPGAAQVWPSPGPLVPDDTWRWYGSEALEPTYELQADHTIFYTAGGTQADSVFSGISTFGRLDYHKCLNNEDVKYGMLSSARRVCLCLN